jgi:hypothetical protein
MHRAALEACMHHLSDYNMSLNEFTVNSNLSPLPFLWKFNLKGFLEGETFKRLLKIWSEVYATG